MPQQLKVLATLPRNSILKHYMVITTMYVTLSSGASGALGPLQALGMDVVNMFAGKTPMYRILRNLLV